MTVRRGIALLATGWILAGCGDSSGTDDGPENAARHIGVAGLSGDTDAACGLTSASPRRDFTTSLTKSVASLQGEEANDAGLSCEDSVKLLKEGGGAERSGKGMPTTSPLATVGSQATVTLLDPVSLAPLRRGITLGEYHDTYSFSPSGTEVAFGISADGGVGGRFGIRVVDARTAEAAGSISTGVYGAGLAWLQSDRLVAVLGDQFVCTPDCPTEDPNFSELIIVNPGTGETLESGRVSHSCDTAEARGRALLSLSERSLSVATADGEVESVRLPRKLAGCGGVTASENGKEALVLSEDGGSIGQISISGGKLTTYALPGRQRVRAVIGLDARHLVVTRAGGGVDLLELGTKNVREIDQAAEEVRIAGSKIIAFGAEGMGARTYDFAGRRQAQLLRGETLVDLGVAGRFAYAVAKNGVALIDLRKDRLSKRSGTRVRGDLLTEPSAP